MDDVRARFRTRWVAAVVAGVLALGATSGIVSVAGEGHGDVAHAAPHAHSARSSDPDGPADAPTAAKSRPSAVSRQISTAPAGRSRPDAFRLVRVTSSMSVRARPRADAPVIGRLPDSSKYYGVDLTAWIEETARRGAWGRVEIPYVWPRRDGWIPLRGLPRARTFVRVHVDISEHRVTVTKFGKVRARFPAATGSSSSPTPPGSYFVTDRIPFPAGGALGSFAFGISGIQPRLPAGWSGGNQLAIHGTNDPSSIGRSASAGCIRVGERSLRVLLPLLRLGTPIVIQR